MFGSRVSLIRGSTLDEDVSGPAGEISKFGFDVVGSWPQRRGLLCGRQPSGDRYGGDTRGRFSIYIYYFLRAAFG
jgi:hypothetical protein